MPNLMERRKIKKQLMSAGQSPVYNIYYTDSVPIQQVPNFTRNLAKFFPQVNKASSLRTRRQPKTNGFFRRTRHFAKDKSYYFGVPFFPEEKQRQRMEQYTMSQSKPPTVEIYKNYEKPICPEHLNYLNYQRNQSADDYLLPNYGYHYKKFCHAANMLELTKSYQQMLSTEQTRSFDNCATSIDLNTKRNETSVSTVDTSNQLITVPTQPINSGNDNSRNIEVQPLRREEIGEENAHKTINEKSEQSLDGNDTIREFLKEEVSGPSCEIGDRVVNGEIIGGDVLTTTCSFFNKKRMSLLRKLSARIRKNKAKPVANVSRLPQTSTYPVSELAKFNNIQSTDLLTFKIQSDNSNWLNAQSNQVTLRKLSNGTEVIVSSMDDDVRSFAYSAQEILSPRQMISSMTNVYAEQRDAENHLRMSERKREYQKKPNNVKSNSSIGSNFQTEKFTSFQDIEEKVENRITRSGLITNTERELLDDILDQREAKSEVNERYPENMLENKKSENIPFKNNIEIRDILNKDTTRSMKNNEALHRRHRHKIYQNSKRIQSQIETHPTVTKENNHHTASMISFICESCKLSNQDKEKEETNPSLLTDSNKFYRQKCNCPKEYVQSNYTILKTTNNVKSVSEKFEPSKSCRHDSTSNPLNYCSRNSLKRYNDNLPPEGTPNHYVNVNPLAPHIHMDNKNNNSNGIYSENGNLTCCGLVMYGQKDSSPSTIRGHYYNRTIPVCGTVSQGISPRYEPNFMSPPYHEQGPFWLQHPQYRQRYGNNRHCEQDNLRDHYHHCHRDLRRQFSAFDDGNVDDPTSHLEFSPPLVLRSLARAANIIMTSIFGRTTVPMSNRTQQRQQYRQSNHHDSIITIRDRKVNREGMCYRRNSENFKEARKTQDPPRH